MTDISLELVLPFMLLLARVSALVATMPLLSWQAMPLYLKSGLCVLLTIFFAVFVPVPTLSLLGIHWLSASLMIVQETMTGLVLGLSANLVFLGVQQGSRIIAQQMGLTDAEIMDPLTGESSEAVSLFFEMTFALLFLAAGGAHVLLFMMAKSYEVFPIGQAPTAAAMAEAVVQAGGTMLLFALKLAAPMLAAFLVLAVVLAMLARVLPDINILLASYPLRIALGFFVAASIVPLMGGFTRDITVWMQKTLQV